MVKRIRQFDKIDMVLYFSILGLSLVLLIFVTNKLFKVKDDVIDSKTKIAKLDNDLARLDRITKERQENLDKLSAIAASLPSSYDDIAYFTQALEKIAQDQVETLEVNIDKTTKSEGGYDSLKFTIKTQGNYTSIKNSLSQLADLPYHTSVDSLKAESEAGELITLTNFRLLMQKQ